jgi:hypothetical protein
VVGILLLPPASVGAYLSLNLGAVISMYLNLNYFVYALY